MRSSRTSGLASGRRWRKAAADQSAGLNGGQSGLGSWWPSHRRGWPRKEPISLSRWRQVRAAELGRKSRRRRRASEVPAQIVEVVFAATESKTSFDASRRMKGVHVVQLFAEAARRHGDLDYVWEVPLDSFRAHAAFVSRHASEYAPFGAICKRYCKLSIGGEYDRATVG